MAAIAKPATTRERFDVIERAEPSSCLLPQLQLAHAGRINHHRAVWQQHELSMARGVSATLVLGQDANRIAMLAP